MEWIVAASADVVALAVFAFGFCGALGRSLKHGYRDIWLWVLLLFSVSPMIVGVLALRTIQTTQVSPTALLPASLLTPLIVGGSLWFWHKVERRKEDRKALIPQTF